MDISTQKTLYEQVADRIQASIAEGTLRPGDRLPSIRKVRDRFSVSMSTAQEAYRVLEDRGAIEAKPRSGYFVRVTPTVHPEEPTRSVPSNRAHTVDTSLALRINAALRQPDIVRLGAAVPSLDLLPVAALNRLLAKAVREYPDLVHSYGAPAGCPELRHEIARRLLEAGCFLAPEQLLVTNGTMEALYLSLQAVAKPGDAIAVESPAYYGLLGALESLHLQALELPTHPREGICLEVLEQVLQQRQVAACMLVSNFSNPLGTCMGDRQKQQVAALLAQYETPLIEDDIYGELHLGAHRPKPIKAFDTEGWVLYCASFSKTLSPGLRVGWVAPGRYHRQVEQLKLFANYSTAMAPQRAIAAFLSNGGYDRHLRKLRNAYRTQIDRMTRAVCTYFPTQTRMTRPEGGHVLWVELPKWCDTLELYEQAYQYRISIAPGPMFSASGNYRNCLRLNCALPWSEAIEQAMWRLGELIERLAARAEGGDT